VIDKKQDIFLMWPIVSLENVSTAYFLSFSD